jgi:hypothetical protein
VENPMFVRSVIEGKVISEQDLNEFMKELKGLLEKHQIKSIEGFIGPISSYKNRWGLAECTIKT